MKSLLLICSEQATNDQIQTDDIVKDITLPILYDNCDFINKHSINIIKPFIFNENKNETEIEIPKKSLHMVLQLCRFLDLEYCTKKQKKSKWKNIKKKVTTIRKPDGWKLKKPDKDEYVLFVQQIKDKRKKEKEEREKIDEERNAKYIEEELLGYKCDECGKNGLETDIAVCWRFSELLCWNCLNLDDQKNPFKWECIKYINGW